MANVTSGTKVSATMSRSCLASFLLTISISKVPRSWSRIKRPGAGWLNWVLLWGPHIRRAAVAVLEENTHADDTGASRK